MAIVILVDRLLSERLKNDKQRSMHLMRKGRRRENIHYNNDEKGRDEIDRKMDADF